MRILIVTTWIPFPMASGVAIRTLEIARRFARRHEVTLAVASRWGEEDEASIAALRKQGFKVISGAGNRDSGAVWEVCRMLILGRPPVNGVRGSRELEQKLAPLAAEFDIVQIENGDFGRLPDQISRWDRPVKGMVLHDLLSEAYPRIARIEPSWIKRLWLYANGWAFGRVERRLLPRFDVAVVMSDRERQVLSRKVPPERIQVVPNCTDLSEPALPPAANPAPVLLFVGCMYYWPNVDAAQWLVQEIFPLVRVRFPAARLLVVGGVPPEGASFSAEGVEVTGRVPDLTPYYGAADIAVAPLRAGGGTRLKILEAMAKGRAVVATALGAEGIGALPGEHLLLAESAAAFAQAIIELCLDPARRQAMARAAREFVEAHFHWDHAADRLLARYEQLHEQRAKLR